MSAFPQGDQWKDPAYVARWKDDRKRALETGWKKRNAGVAPLLTGTPLAATPNYDLAAEIHGAAAELIHWENESIAARARRLEPAQGKKHRSADQARHQVPALIAGNSRDGFIEAAAVDRATEDKKTKARWMLDLGLEKKAQRDIACGILGGEIECKSGHKFRVAYECGNRYCPSCAVKDGRKLFARQVERLRFAASRLMICKQDCQHCGEQIEKKELPHWPPARGSRPRIVCAKIDFTLRHDRDSGLPSSERMRELNGFIKKFCRALEKRFSISRKDYGLAYCDELGGNNSNPHAHGIYVGPWLPQKKKELSALWREITGDSFILSIKYAHGFAEALFHAIKYPAKFAERSSPKRLAELEKVFHRVRRFHTLAAFYNPECPPAEKPLPRRCPVCDDFMSEPRGWQTIAELIRRGLRDLEAVSQELKKARGLGDLPPP